MMNFFGGPPQLDELQESTRLPRQCPTRTNHSRKA